MDSDETVTGGETPEEKTAVEAKPPEPPAAPTASAVAAKPPKKPNWMLIALIVVSCVAVFLLIVALALGAGLAFHHERGDRFDGRRQMGGPMMRGYGEGGWGQRPNWLRQSAPPAQSAPPSGQ